MDDSKAVSLKIPMEVYNEMALRIPEGERSEFIREAITEKLERTPKADRLLSFEERLTRLEGELGEIRKYLADLEILTFQRGKINPHAFCIDNIDHKIIDYLLHYKGATTPEMADYLQTNRWMILNRLRRIQRKSKKQIGKPIIIYSGAERVGKRKAWWINEEVIQE